MKNLLAFFIIALLLVSCVETTLEPSTCTTPATVRDLTGLDGCGWVFELEDGTRLEPIRVFYCGTPPLPAEIPQDPLYNFEFVDGKTVYINYEEIASPSICMVGTTVNITCISDRVTANNE
jgi:hypothetical protein